MALQGGHRFTVSMAEVFPHGVYAMAVEQAMEMNERNGQRVTAPAKDKQTGETVWTVTVMDRDPEARTKEVKVKVLGGLMPMLPGEIVAGTGLHAVDFVGMSCTPYIAEGAPGRKSRLALMLL